MITRRALLPGALAVGIATCSRPARASGVASCHLCVMDFGADGDGVADDTAAFAAAITHLVEHGGALHVPAGKYKITAPLPFANLLERSMGVRVYGDGPSSEIRPTLLPGNSRLFQFHNAVARVVIADIAFVGDMVDSHVDCGTLIYGSYCLNGIEVSRCTFAGLRSTTHLVDSYVSNMTLRGCQFGGCSALSAVRAYEFRRLSIDDCMFLDYIGQHNKTSAGGNGAWVWAARPNYGAMESAAEQGTVIVRNCTFDEGASTQIRLESTDGARIQRALVEDCNFNVSGATGAFGVFAKDVDRLAVARSRFSWALGATRDAVRLEGVDVAELAHIYAVSGASRISADAATQYVHLRDCVYGTLASQAVVTKVETKGVVT